jgi:DNA polymerase III subunit epsilon
MYAIVDIETTGGSPSQSKIIEIAIIIHDGKEILNQFTSLVNPQCRVPSFISQFTGITDDMLVDAPAFHEIAKEIIELTEGTTFVAHNVKFDYGFVKAAFKDLGYNYQRKTLCTVRLSRSTFAGLPSYSLGKLCNSLNIQIENRHRALGDAEATAILFSKIFEQNKNLISNDWIPEEIKNIAIPPLLNETIFENIPEYITGVYYFHNQQGDVIYIGKGKNIKKRILQHFANQKSKKSIRMQHEIADISYENTGSELIALLLESDEIKKLKPLYNTAQKRTRLVPFYGIYSGVDESGYITLFAERIKAESSHLTSADNFFAAKNILYKAIDQYKLCLSKSGLHKVGGPCFNYQIHKCEGACVEKESPDSYNIRVKEAIESLSFKNQSFFIVDKGREMNEKSVICIEMGEYKGFGYIDKRFSASDITTMRECIKKYNHNKDIQNIINAHIKKGLRIIKVK